MINALRMGLHSSVSPRKGRRTARLVVLLLVLAVATGACTEAPSTEGRATGSLRLKEPIGTSTGGPVVFNGGRIDVPQGALAYDAHIEVRPAVGGLGTSEAASLLRPLRGIDVSLRGAQPKKPLRVTLATGKLPLGTDPTDLFIAIAPGTGGRPIDLLPATYRTANNTLQADVPHLSRIFAVALNRDSVAGWMAETMLHLLKLRAARPACARSSSVQLPDGSAVRFADGEWNRGLDPWLWACLELLPGAAELRVQLTNNRPEGYSLDGFPPGATLGRMAPSLDSLLTRLLYDIATAGTNHGRELLSATSTVSMTVPLTKVPEPGAVLQVAAANVDPAMVMAGGAQVAFNSLLLLYAPALNGALNVAANTDCLLANLLAPAVPTFDDLVRGAQIGLRCVGGLLQGGKGLVASLALRLLHVVTAIFTTAATAFTVLWAILKGGVGGFRVGIRRDVVGAVNEMPTTPSDTGNPSPTAPSPSPSPTSPSPSPSPTSPSPSPSPTSPSPSPSPTSPSPTTSTTPIRLVPADPSNVYWERLYGNLHWTDNSDNEDGFHIYANDVHVGDEPANATELLGTYVFHHGDLLSVSAYNTNGESARIPSSNLVP